MKCWEYMYKSETLCCEIHSYNASNEGEKKQKTQLANRFLLLVIYHIILSIEISSSLFILLVLLHYILGWVGCFFLRS